MTADLRREVQGGCHCGAIRFSAVVRTAKVTRCNCSICTKKGYLHLIIPESDFNLISGRDDIATYTFGTQTAKHHFCRHCGIHAFYRPRSHPEHVDINVHCLEEVDPTEFEVVEFDGRHWDSSVDALRRNLAGPQ